MCEASQDLALHLQAFSMPGATQANVMRASTEPDSESYSGPLLKLDPVDSLDATIVVDNFVDVLLPSEPGVFRPTLTWSAFEGEALVAEHGYSLLVSVTSGERTGSILYDGGLSRAGLTHNLDVLGVSIADLRAITLSHGHADHHGGLEGLIRRVGRRNLPLLLHPDAWRNRKVVFPTGAEVHLPPPSRADLEREGISVIEDRSPSLLIDSMVLITGQIERHTTFERGFPIHYAQSNGSWQPDIWIWDDQAAVINVRNRGLVVLSGCSHAGAINVMRHAQHITGIEHIHAFIGGMHLTGRIFEPIIEPTLDELARIAPDVLVPGHCTGWKATHEIARRFPRAYIQSSVGTRLHFA